MGAAGQAAGHVVLGSSRPVECDRRIDGFRTKAPDRTLLRHPRAERQDAEVETFIRDVQRQIGRSLFGVMDRLAAHRSAARRLGDDDRFVFEWLPVGICAGFESRGSGLEQDQRPNMATWQTMFPMMRWTWKSRRKLLWKPRPATRS